MTPEGLKRESEIQRSESVTAHTAKKLDKLTIALLLAVVVIVIADRFVPETGTATEPVIIEQVTQTNQPAESEEPAPAMPSLAVLPFTNMSADPDNEYFSDGISEELLNLLVQVDGLRVPSRTSSFAFKGMNMDIKEIAQKLAVEHILEGSVRKAGNQVRVTAQLIDVSTDTHLWSNTYDRELENIFAIQDEISREIIRELKIALDTSGFLPREASKPTEDMQAYQDYLRGRHMFIQRGIPSLKASLEAMQSAVARDPEFTEAWAGLSLTAATLSGWDPELAEETNRIALEAGNKALQLDPDSATALTGLGVLNYNKGYWAQSLDLLARASSLSKDSNPTYFFGMVLQTCGYLKEARDKFLQAEILDPVYPQLQSYLGLNAMLWNETDMARVHFQRTIDGGNDNGPFGMYWIELHEGNIDSAIAYIQDIVAIQEAGQGAGLQRKAADVIAAALKDPSLSANAIKAAVEEEELITLGYFDEFSEIIKYLNRVLAEDDMLTLAIELGNYLWAADYSSLREMPEYKQFLINVNLVDLWKERGWPDLCHPIGEDDFECK
jgi:TolB-like protein/Tfp pilus assembly protein PilF